MALGEMEVGEEALHWYTVPELARLLRVSDITVHRRIMSGELESVKVGTSRRVTPGQFRRYTEKLEKQSQGEVA